MPKSCSSHFQVGWDELNLYLHFPVPIYITDRYFLRYGGRLNLYAMYSKNPGTVRLLVEEEKRKKSDVGSWDRRKWGQ
ncbi:hypothetical protein OSCI_3490058 [Kamptonema sp. PCC 6506]|uniref:hypothetical protein n=1 Tax=Kamptonema formosum TaxID=331992 RepID=UPI0001DAD0C7|nr:hypothetical protein [Kamptonema formosum]CBN57678.1 hypothetical protein OSCI_3490058 [Kamptonema sp. PCC 6506]